MSEEEELSFLYTDDNETGNIDTPNYSVTTRNDVRPTTPVNFLPSSNSNSVIQELSTKINALEKEKKQYQVENESMMTKILRMERLLEKHLSSKTKEFKKQLNARQFIRFKRNLIKQNCLKLIEEEEKKLEQLKRKEKLQYEQRMKHLDVSFNQSISNVKQDGRTKFEKFFKS